MTLLLDNFKTKDFLLQYILANRITKNEQSNSYINKSRER